MRLTSFALVLASTATLGLACAGGAAPAPAAANAETKSDALVGRYVLFMRRIGSQPPDAIELRSDGSCIADLGAKPGVGGTWRASPDGVFTVTLGSSPIPILSGKYQLRKYALRLSPGELTELFYVRWPMSPSRPPPPEGELLGIQTSSSEMGTIAQQLTADHRYEVRGRDLLQEYRAYWDFQMRGTFTYAQGIVTYRPSESTALEKVEYLNDFVVSREGKCLWIVDPVVDRLTCVTRATTLDIGPPPAGFHEGPRP